MYDAGVTAHHVAAEIARTANAPDEADRFYGVYHSLSEVQQFIAHANALVDPETGELRRKLTVQERQWIRNERTLCMLDFRGYWAIRYAKIVDFRNQLVTFNPNIAQNIVMDVWAEMERKQWAIMMLQLKARQMGVSTLTELAVQHRIQFYPDVNAVVASVEEDKSAKMFRMVEVSLSHQPWFLMPRNKKWKIGKLVEFSNNSAVSVESGNQLSGIAMGTTPQVAHISEVAKMRNAQVLIDQSLLHAVHEDNFTLVVLESTAEGFDNWFYRTWKDAVLFWSQGKSTLFPIFLPWFVARDIYPTAAWLRKHPVPIDWVPSEMTEKHAIRAALSVKTNPRLTTLFPVGWTMPREQQWYYEVKRDEAVRTKQLNTFLSEMPADPDEAFQSSQISAVDPVLVNAYRERALGQEPLAVFAIIAAEDELHARFNISKRLWDKTKKPVVIETYTGRVTSTYTLQPLIFDGYDGDPKGKLYVWEWPEDGQEYGLGCDTGDGVDQDSSVCEIMKKSTVWKPWTQVAEFACLAPDSLVITPSGVKRIQHVKAGDEIITRLGSIATVGHVKTTHRPKAVKVFTGMATNVPLELTDDHQIATASGWVEAANLKPGDWLRYPVRPLAPIVSGSIPLTYRGVSNVIELSRDFGFMCGLYLAEGFIELRSHGVVSVSFTLHQREADPWLKVIQRVCPSWHVNVSEPSNCKNARKLKISSSALAQWMNNEFGRTQTKHIPGWAWNAPRDFIEGLVSGMVAGDGAIDRRCYAAKYTSILPSLTLGLRDLVLSLGWGLGVVSFWDRRPKAQGVWNVDFYGDSAKNFCTEEMIRPLPRSGKPHRTHVFRWGWQKQWVYVKVNRVLPSDATEFVDLHVEGDEPSFCVAQAAVHNSPYMNAMDLWPIVQAIATFYSVKRQNELKQPKLVIECRGTGDLLQNELRKRGWSNFHIPVRVDKRRLDVGKSHYMGIMTAPWVRRAMVDKFLSMFNNEEIELASPWLIEEVRRLERDEAKQQFRAAGGAHDDRVMGCSFVLLSLDVLGLNPKSHRRTEATDDDPSYHDAHAYVDPDLKSLSVAVRPSPMSRMRF